MHEDDREIIASSLDNSFWTCPIDDLSVKVLDIDAHLNDHGYWLLDIEWDDDNAEA